MEDHYAIPQSLVKSIIQYLSIGRPLEVARMIVALDGLQKIKIVDEANGENGISNSIRDGNIASQ